MGVIASQSSSQHLKLDEKLTGAAEVDVDVEGAVAM